MLQGNTICIKSVDSASETQKATSGIHKDVGDIWHWYSNFKVS